MSNNDLGIGFLRYSGKLVDEGIMDGRKSANALLGFDESLRFFIGLQDSSLAQSDFEIPVRIQKGSWEAIIPHTIGQWILASIGVAGTAYITTAATKIAEKDFKELGIKDIVKKALKTMQWIIKIGKHIKDLHKKQFANVKFGKNNEEIGIPNDTGELLFVPKDIYETYISTSPAIFNKIASIIEEERQLSIGVFEESNTIIETIYKAERHIFSIKAEEDGEVIFPEMIHGKYVSLEGSATRGNENTNSIGFKYQGHILSCYPSKGSVVTFKPALFENCKITGSIDRTDRLGRFLEKNRK